MALTIKHISDSRIEQLQMFVSLYCAMKNISISDSAIKVTAVLMEYGIKSDTSKLIMSMMNIKVGSYWNIMSVLHKVNILTHSGNYRGYQLHKDLCFDTRGSVILIIKLETLKIK